MHPGFERRQWRQEAVTLLICCRVHTPGGRAESSKFTSAACVVTFSSLCHSVTCLKFLNPGIFRICDVVPPLHDAPAKELRAEPFLLAGEGLACKIGRDHQRVPIGNDSVAQPGAPSRNRQEQERGRGDSSKTQSEPRRNTTSNPMPATIRITANIRFSFPPRSAAGSEGCAGGGAFLLVPAQASMSNIEVRQNVRTRARPERSPVGCRASPQ